MGGGRVMCPKCQTGEDRTCEHPGKVLLWHFTHEMRAALAFREKHPEVKLRRVRNLDLVRDYEAADVVYAGTYCWGRIAKMYAPQEVEEVWLQPDYRHQVEVTEYGYQLYEKKDMTWFRKGEAQPTEEDAWGILDTA